MGENGGDMMKRHRMSMLASGVLALLGTSLSLQAAEPAKLADWNLGEVQIGKPVTKAELKGQVVVLDYWGAW
jgi:hypothetical protein